MNDAPVNSSDSSVVWQTLRCVMDPEMGLNIVDLGLIYDVSINGSKIAVTMTVTTPGCPMQDSLKWGVHSALMNLEGVEDVEVQIVWEPRWTPDRIAAEARLEMGLV